MKKVVIGSVIAMMILFISTSAQAQEGFIGEVKMFAGNFAPRNWALCEGQLLAINQNQALFSILGTTYGGDGRTTFALPDMRGRVVMAPGQGPGLTAKRLGEKGGQEKVTLTVQQMPSHTHQIKHSLGGGGQGQAGNSNTPGAGGGPGRGTPAPNSELKPTVTLTNTGGGQAHENMQPYVAVNYIICLTGIFPSRN